MKVWHGKLEGSALNWCCKHIRGSYHDDMPTGILPVVHCMDVLKPGFSDLLSPTVSQFREDRDPQICEAGFNGLG